MTYYPGHEHMRQAAAANPALAAELNTAAQEARDLAEQIARITEGAAPYYKPSRKLIQDADAADARVRTLQAQLRREAEAMWERDLDAPAR
jgi:hypothetical protein